ncbi:hypothetical protein FRB99_001587 [Tulasnella sp. 403]|nr:hypothetical protein FRB99_001587 [Tulasnella sp. 403]
MGKRTLVLCFDGTDNRFREDRNTNVVHLMSMLEREPTKMVPNKTLEIKGVPDSDKAKNRNDESADDEKDSDERRSQRVYYQTGIGTYDPSGRSSWIITSKLNLALDQAVAWYLEDHVLGGYKFLMEHYRPDDEICMFSFSRGAYTASLGRYDPFCGSFATQQYRAGTVVPFAYEVFKGTGERNNSATGTGLAKNFKATFSRDNVEIHFVGLCVKHVRHALSLDENCAKFKAEPWDPPAEKQKWVSSDDDAYTHLNTEEDDERQKRTNVKEVWFAGYHGDVGGGWESSKPGKTLANIPLRWLVREARTLTNINWNNKMLEDFLIIDENGTERRDPDYLEIEKNEAMSGKDHSSLEGWSKWWPLEYIPLHQMSPDKDGNWKSTPQMNKGGARVIRVPKQGEKTWVHSSVLTRKHLRGYTPAAKWLPEAVEIEDDWALPDEVRELKDELVKCRD